MDVLVLTVVCVAGLLAAALAVVAWGGLEVRPRGLAPGERAPETARRLLRSLSIALLAGGVAGALTSGLGGRLMMRVLAATSSDRVQGFPTEAEETIGEITLDGSIGFVMFIGVFSGLLGGVLYLALRRWLPGRSARTAGLVLGVLGLSLGPMTDALDRDNTDFVLLDPDPLAVTLIVGIFLLGGMTVASVVERADRSWPEARGRPTLRTAAVYAPLVVLISAWPVAVGFVAVVLATVALQRSEAVMARWSSAGADRAGRVVVTLAALAALVLAGSHAVDILTGEDLVALAVG